MLDGALEQCCCWLMLGKDRSLRPRGQGGFIHACPKVHVDVDGCAVMHACNAITDTRAQPRRRDSGCSWPIE